METESKNASSDQTADQKVSKKYKCSFEGCKLEFLKPNSLKFHINVHLKEVCIYCNLSFTLFLVK